MHFNSNLLITPELIQYGGSHHMNGTASFDPAITNDMLLKSEFSLHLNGTMRAPESLREGVYSIIHHINGSLTFFPDNAVFLDRPLEIDDAFLATARQDGVYYSPGKIVFLHGDLQKFSALNLTLHADHAITRVGYEEVLHRAFRGRDIALVPDEAMYISGDYKLDDFAVEHYGDSYYIEGNAHVVTLEKVRSLYVKGRVTIATSLVAQFLTLCPGYPKERLLVYPNDVMMFDHANIRSGMLTAQTTLVVYGHLKVEQDVSLDELSKIDAIYLFGKLDCHPSQFQLLQSLCRNEKVMFHASEDIAVVFPGQNRPNRIPNAMANAQPNRSSSND